MTEAIDDLKVVFENSPIPGISKMRSAYFVLTILPEIPRISLRFKFFKTKTILLKSEQK